MTKGVHGTLAGATEFAHCYKILAHERNYSMVSSLGEVTGAIMEQSSRHESDLSFNPFRLGRPGCPDQFIFLVRTIEVLDAHRCRDAW